MIHSPGIKLLLVEDDPVTAIMECMELREEGYHVVHASSADQALSFFQEPGNSFDLVLMDTDLGPGVDGAQTAKKILELKEVPILFLSSYTDRKMVEKAEAVSSYGYVVKNTGKMVLFASIKMALRLAAANKRLIESELTFQTAFRCSPVPMSLNDLGNNNRFIDCNEAFTRLTGYPHNEIVGKTSIELDLYANPDDRSRLLDLLKKDRQVDGYEFTLRTKSGELINRTLSLVQITINGVPYSLATVGST